MRHAVWRQSVVLFTIGAALFAYALARFRATIGTKGGVRSCHRQDVQPEHELRALAAANLATGLF
jgi:hypothetical protein